MLRDFILPESRSSISGEAAYRFKHVLIREVAYSGLSKSERADHHLRFASWLKERAGEELLEVRAYHLDHAASLKKELEGDVGGELAAEAAAALDEAGRRAFARDANRAARRLFLSALELEPTLERRYEAARAAWRITDYPVVSREMEEVCAAAEAEGNRRIQGRALTALADAAVVRDADVPRAERLIGKALDVIEPDDNVGRVDALGISATIAWARGDLAAEERVAEEPWPSRGTSAVRIWRARCSDTLASVYIGQLELDRAQPLADRALALAEETGSVAALGRAHRFLGQLYLARGDYEEAESQLAEARKYLEEVGRLVGARAHAQLLRLGCMAERRRGARGTPPAGIHPHPRAARGPRDAVRVAALTGPAPGRAGQAGRGRASRSRGAPAPSGRRT